MAADDLKTVRLIRLYPEMKFSSTLAYYMVYREECQNMPKLVAFKTWLTEAQL